MNAPFQQPERRRAPRLATSLAGSLRERGRPAFSVELVDLSTHGCRIELSSDLQPGAWVWLKLPGLEPRYSRVAWCRGCFAGIEFEVPLHEAVVDCLVAMDYVPSASELDRLRCISERCRSIAARMAAVAGDETCEELLALARYCEAGAGLPEPLGPPGPPTV
jgi:hypothetical protein